MAPPSQRPPETRKRERGGGEGKERDETLTHSIEPKRLSRLPRLSPDAHWPCELAAARLLLERRRASRLALTPRDISRSQGAGIASLHPLPPRRRAPPSRVADSRASTPPCRRADAHSFPPLLYRRCELNVCARLSNDPLSLPFIILSRRRPWPHPLPSRSGPQQSASPPPPPPPPPHPPTSAVAASLARSPAPSLQRMAAHHVGCCAAWSRPSTARPHLQNRQSPSCLPASAAGFFPPTAMP